MSNEQIRIDIEATDDASAVIDEVAGAADALEQLSPEIPVTADTTAAEGALEDVESAADTVGRLTPEVEVRADTTRAETDIETLEDKASGLDDADYEVVLKAKVAAATKALKDLRGDLDTTEAKADTTRRAVDDVGSKGGELPAGNAIADLAGPLGDAEGAASTAAGAVEGFTDIASGIAGKLGASEKAVAGITTTLGGVGLALAAVAAAYTYFSGKADAAKQKQEELTSATRDYNEALSEGDWKAAAEQLEEMFRDPIEDAEDLGISVDNVAKYITGAADTIPDLDRALRANADEIKRTKDRQDAYYESTGFLNERLVTHQQRLLTTKERLTGLKDSTKAAKDQLAGTNDTILAQNRRTNTLAKALRDTEGDTDDLTKAQRDLERQSERLERQMDDLKGALSFDRTMQAFEDDFKEAFRKVRDGKRLTKDDILGLKENILDVAEYAKMTPAEVRALLRKVDRGDVQGVRDAVQAYMDAHTVETPAGIKLKPDAAQDAHNEAQRGLDAQGPVQVPTVYGPAQAPSRSGVGPVPQMVNPAPPVTEVVNVTMHLPRGYRELDVIAAGRRAARRHGGLYRRVHR